MNTILLHPTDVLFFRDGRPMGGASSGQGAAWPLPNIISHAFHAALHRAQLDGVHKHVPGRSSSQRDYSDANRQLNGRLFGSLTTAGPFPVQVADKQGTSIEPQWFFPRPLDAGMNESTQVSLHPTLLKGNSSLPAPLTHAVGSSQPPSKDQPNPWWSQAAWRAYLHQGNTSPEDFKADTAFSDTEHAFGIGMNPDTQTQDGERIYSAHYLRMRDAWRLGTFALAEDKDFHHPVHGNDLVQALLNGHGTEIIAGGQQRICTASLHAKHGQALPLPIGKTEQFGEKHLVKWVLLTPAIWPQIGEHTGGWLPSWIDMSGKVQLLNGPGKNYAQRHKVPVGQPISARLVAAITGKPIPVTGYALPNTADPERTEGGAKSTHLAVPAGAVYYFECQDESAAQALAAALNWHGAGDTTTIRNRRSTLMGEKGFGLGVCGTWHYHDGTHTQASDT